MPIRSYHAHRCIIMPKAQTSTHLTTYTDTLQTFYKHVQTLAYHCHPIIHPIPAVYPIRRGIFQNNKKHIPVTCPSNPQFFRGRLALTRPSASNATQSGRKAVASCACAPTAHRGGKRSRRDRVILHRLSISLIVSYVTHKPMAI